jgi:hypothetical protein
MSSSVFAKKKSAAAARSSREVSIANFTFPMKSKKLARWLAAFSPEKPHPQRRSANETKHLLIHDRIV